MASKQENISTAATQWSARMKHSGVKVNSKVLSRTTIGLNKFGFYGIGGLAHCISEATQNGKHEWTIRIISYKRAMQVGICQIRQAQ